MSDPIMVYSAFMRMEIDRLNSIAGNTSNTNSAGYLHETTSIDPEKFLSLLQGDKATDAYIKHKSTDLGALKITGRGSDVALTTDDWFVVSLDGKEFVTRNGAFNLSASGELKLGSYKVVADGGEIHGVTNNFRIHANGDIYSEEKYVDTIKLVKLPKGFQLHSVGGGVYQFEGKYEPAENPKVIQGALVNSNVDLASDMTRMIEITRHIESIQRAISAYDSILDTGINELGK